MKKLLIGCAVAAMMMSPVSAKAGDDWVGPAIAGTIFGIIIGNSGHHHSEVIIERPRHRHNHYRRPHQRHPRGLRCARLGRIHIVIIMVITSPKCITSAG